MLVAPAAVVLVVRLHLPLVPVAIARLVMVLEGRAGAVAGLQVIAIVRVLPIAVLAVGGAVAAVPAALVGARRGALGGAAVVVLPVGAAALAEASPVVGVAAPARRGEARARRADAR